MKKRSIITGVIIVAAIIAACAAFWSFTRMLTTDYHDYYTQADNNRVTEIDHDDFNYEYTLQSFDADGEAKEYIFMTADKLREDAFLHLYTLPFRGVVKWEYVEADELPDPVRKMYETT